jgi:predicted HTH domain antitoxin
MRTVQLNIDLPEMNTASESWLKIFLAAKLYERQDLSLGQAADAAGLPKRAFAELLGSCGVSLFSYSMNELHDDLANA